MTVLPRKVYRWQFKMASPIQHLVAITLGIIWESFHSKLAIGETQVMMWSSF